MLKFCTHRLHHCTSPQVTFKGFNFSTLLPTFVIFIYIFYFIIIFLNLFILFIYSWLCCVFVAGRGLSLVAVSGGYSSFAVCGLLIAVASLVVEHGLWARRLQ